MQCLLFALALIEQNFVVVQAFNVLRAETRVDGTVVRDIVTIVVLR